MDIITVLQAIVTFYTKVNLEGIKFSILKTTIRTSQWTRMKLAISQGLDYRPTLKNLSHHCPEKLVTENLIVFLQGFTPAN